MQAIAVIQAQNGDDMAAKRTVSQIGNESERGPSDVVAVCCFEGHIFYDHLPGSFSGPAPLPPARLPADSVGVDAILRETSTS